MSRRPPASRPSRARCATATPSAPRTSPTPVLCAGAARRRAGSRRRRRRAAARHRCGRSARRDRRAAAGASRRLRRLPPATACFPAAPIFRPAISSPAPDGGSTISISRCWPWPAMTQVHGARAAHPPGEGARRAPTSCSMRSAISWRVRWTRAAAPCGAAPAISLRRSRTSAARRRHRHRRHRQRPQRRERARRSPRTAASRRTASRSRRARPRRSA